MALGTSFERVPADLVDSLTEFAGHRPGEHEAGLVQVVPFGQNDFVLVAPSQTAPMPSVLAQLKDAKVESYARSSAYEVLIGVLGHTSRELGREVLSRGVAIQPVHDALAEVLGVPRAWKRAQESLVYRALEPLRIGGELKTADLYATTSNGRHRSREWLNRFLGSWEPPSSTLVYLEAEAGKGKSTIVAEAVLSQLASGAGPLPLYVPLRSIQRGAGVSWADIAGCLGVFGPACDVLARAVRSGLVTLVLDGLDEVSGRYDPTVVNAVLDEVFSNLTSTRSRLLLSGRKTEASLVKARKCLTLGLELPETSDEAFITYVQLVVRGVAPTWHALYPRVPEPPLEVVELAPAPVTEEEERRILDWICAVFDELGKERSLFFVQSLAGLARTYQLAGNKPLVIKSAAGVHLAQASLYDVCVLAASLACIREQDKIEDIAKALFTPGGQLDILTWLALRSAAPDSVAVALPNPNEVAKDRFHIDPVNQNEEFTAVVRQVQKHALLFATMDGGPRIGDWKPFFLSEWIRDALLCRAWFLRTAMAGITDVATIEEAVTCSQRAALAFRYILPQVAADPARRDDIQALGEGLRKSAAAGVPEASAHYWELRAGLDGDSVEVLGLPPKELAALADLSDVQFEGLEFGGEFSGSIVVLVGAHFDGCTLVGVRLDQCDLSRAVFSDCVLRDVEMSYCDGPVVFENCRFLECRLREWRMAAPAVTFVGCTFADGTMLSQSELPTSRYAAAFQFTSCEAVVPAKDLLSGAGLGFEVERAEGISERAQNADPDPAVACLRGLLKPFFPTWAGPAAARQVRAYIRTSALGRGAMPAGAPPPVVLEEVLRSEGFTSGGRQAHLYAPWAGVVGGGADAVALRNELSSFVTRGVRSPRVERMLDRIRRAMQ